MLKHELIELSSIEATAYWWINLIRYRVREIATSGANDKNEVRFAGIFYNFTAIDWRRLYLELIMQIAKDVENYIPKSPSDFFNQDTDVNGHDRINDEISKIIGSQIPNIRLAGNGIKDSVIYTTVSFASVWYKSCGVDKLPTKYEPSYVLTGDNKSLDFYNLLITTIAVLDKRDNSFRSVSILRERFCNEYMRLSKSKEKIEDIIEMFNLSFDKANDKGIILGRSFKQVYFASFQDIDYVGLEPYIDLANHYANVVLQIVKDNDAPRCKMLKNQKLKS